MKRSNLSVAVLAAAAIGSLSRVSHAAALQKHKPTEPVYNKGDDDWRAPTTAFQTSGNRAQRARQLSGMRAKNG